jgi:PAS domain S-box-containing protein
MKLSTKNLFGKIKFEHKITFAYFIFGLLWIIFSDKILDLLVPDDSLLTQFQTFKGGFFILITTLFLYLFVRSHIRKLNKADILRLEVENRYKAIFKDNLSVILIINPDNGNIEDANQAACDYYGWTYEEICSKKINDISNLPAEKVNEILINTKLKKKNHLLFEHKLANGVIRDVEVFSGPIKFNNSIFLYALVHDITDRKQALESLSISEEKLRAIFDVLPFGISLIDNDRSITQTNKVLEDIIKLNYGDIQDGKHKLRKYLRSDGSEMPPAELASLRAINEQRVIQDVETGIQTDDGSVYWTSVSAAPLNVEGLSAVVVTHDINARKHAEEALRLSEAQFRNIFESAVIGIYRTTPDGRILMANPTLINMLGFNSFDELAKRNLEEQGFETNTHRAEFRKRIEESGSITGYESIWKTKDGASVIISENAKVFYNNFGEVLYYEGTIEDITERKKVERALRESEERYRKAFKTSPDAININRMEDGMYISINHGFTETTGFCEEDVIGKTSLEFDIWNNREDRKRLVSALTAKGFVRDFEAEFRSKSGRVIYAIMSAAQIEINGIPHIISITRDITDRRKAEEEIRALNESLEMRVQQRTIELEAVNKELEAFTYSVSHDLRAPLRHINGYVDMLTSKYTDLIPEKGLHYLNTIVDASHQMGTLIDDLLQFSRTGRQEMQLAEVDMNDVLNEVLELVKHDIINRRIKWEIEEPLPQLNGDFSLLRMVWFNLISNAVKFTRNKPEAVIHITSEQKEDEYIFSVIDNGAGFDMRYAHKLFGVFQRLHSVQEFEGTGIGLANVRRIISKHGGRTWAESELEKGATFYFSLPKTKVEKNGRTKKNPAG